MNKKLVSVILSTLFLSETALALPTETKNKKQPETTKSQNEKNEFPDLKDLVFDALCATGLSALTVGVCHNASKEAPKNQPQASQDLQCEPAAEPQKETTQDSQNDIPQESQEETPKDSDGKPPKKRQKRATKRSRRTPSKSSLPKTRQTGKTERKPLYPRWEVIESLRDNPNACSAPIPLRAIAWHGDRCWFHASLLHFYHNSFYHEPILRFPVEEARQLVLSGHLNEQERATMEAMICLSEIFRILVGNEDSADFRQPQVVFLGHGRENDLIAKLAKFNKLFSAQPANETLARSYCSQNVCTTAIDTLLNESAKYAQNQSDHPELQRWFNNSFVFQMRTNDIPNEAPIVYVGTTGYHFWVEVEHRGTTFEIGRSTLPHQNSIRIKSGS